MAAGPPAFNKRADGTAGAVACNRIRGYLVRCSWCCNRPSRSVRPSASARATPAARWAASRRCRQPLSSAASFAASCPGEGEAGTVPVSRMPARGAVSSIPSRHSREHGAETANPHSQPRSTIGVHQRNTVFITARRNFSETYLPVQANVE